MGNHLESKKSSSSSSSSSTTTTTKTFAKLSSLENNNKSRCTNYNIMRQQRVMESTKTNNPSTTTSTTTTTSASTGIPIGLNGPTQFEFSPSIMNEKTKQYDQQYLSFLSCYKPLSNQSSINTNGNNSTSSFITASPICNSPVRTIGGSNGVGNQSSSSNEKYLCVMDLRPFYKTIELAKEQRKKKKKMNKKKKKILQQQQQQQQHFKQKQNQSTYEQIQSMQIDDEKNNTATTTNNQLDDDNTDDDEINFHNEDQHQNNELIEPMTDPNLVMNDHVCHLLNTSLPLNRISNNCNQTSITPLHPQSPKSSTSSSRTPTATPTSPLNEKMSLEERLRMERQRLHSNGIHQFDWTSVSNNPRNTTTATTYTTATNNNNNTATNNRNKTNNITSKIKFKYKKIKDSIRILVPLRGNIYIQDGVGSTNNNNDISSPLRLLYDKTMLEDYISMYYTLDYTKDAKKKKKKKVVGGGGAVGGGSANNSSIVGRDASAIDPQLSPDGTMVAFVVAGEIFVMSCGDLFTIQEEEEEQKSFDLDCGGSSNICEDFRSENNCTRDSDGDGDEMIIDTTIGHNNDGGRSGEYTVFVESRKPRRVTYGAMINSSQGYDEFDDSSSSDDGDDDNDEDSENEATRKRRYGRSVTHGLADFVSQEEMDRYRGFWWDKNSNGILFVRVDESCVPPYRITHQGKDGVASDETNYEDHRYPFAGEHNPEVSLGYVPIDREVILLGNQDYNTDTRERDRGEMDDVETNSGDTEIEDKYSKSMWSRVKWFDPPKEASEYLARVNWLPCGSACVQWQDRRQSKLILSKIDVHTGESIILHREESDIWINLHHMFHVLPKVIHPSECIHQDRKDTKCKSLPKDSFSFLFASERTGYCHLYLYTYIPGDLGATLLRAVSSGEWIVESIAGVDFDNDAVYITGTYDSPLEKHLYMLPLKGKATSGVMGVRQGFKQVLNTFSKSSKKQNIGGCNHAPPVNTDDPPNPIRLTSEPGMHSIAMDKNCRLFVDTSSDLTRPPSSKVYSIADVQSGETNLLFVLYDSSKHLKGDSMPFPPPELISVTTSDGGETLHAALYTPDPLVHGSGPYPLICSVYGGPHVQRVNRSWNQSVDMRAQRLCSLGFAVVKCDNRGSSRRGLAFEAAIKNNLGRVEVLDQVAVVRNLVMKQIADRNNVGIFGWSYGGYLAGMCLCRARDVFKVAIAGAPVTSWDGYDTHYTERYMGLPKENSSGYHEAALLNHIQNMRGKLMIIHGLIDENVHFRHTARLINRLVANGKDYDLLIFPDERHSPRRLRDRVYMEKRMNEYFVKNLLGDSNNNPRLLGHL